MYSIDFPNMLGDSRVNLAKDHAATWNNLRLILMSEKTSLFGDPYYGTNLQNVIFSQNSTVLREMIADELLTTIHTFMPQLQLTRNNIEVFSKGTGLYASIHCLNKIDYTTDLYTIKLIDAEENK